MEDLLIQNARQIITASAMPVRGPELNRLKIFEDCSLYLRNGMIQAIGPLTLLEKEITGQPLVLRGDHRIVVPGWVDSHTHLVFAGTREAEFHLRNAGAGYQEIAAKGGGILSTVRATRRADREELVAIGSRYLAAALQHGTTTMEIKTGYGLDLENELKLLQVIHDLQQVQPIELVTTFLGAHAVPPNKSLAEYTEEVMAWLPEIAPRAKFCDLFCEHGYFGLAEAEKIFSAAQRYGLKLRMHADQLSANGGVSLAVSMGAAAVDHLEKIGDAEITLLANSNTCATLLPGVSLFLHYGYPPGRALIDRGAVVSLASNFNPGSCMCLNMQLIISLACTQMAFSAEEAINAATVNGAYSLGLSEVGLIEVGRQADLLLLDLPDYRLLPYFFGINHVHTVIKKGRIVWSNG